MTSTKPFGSLATADIFVIGHDPRLQSSEAEADVVFFLDYLQKYAVAPGSGPEKSKYGLARGLVGYVGELAGCAVGPERLYVTNLCNEFLPGTNGKGTVLIPQEKAERGYREICQASDAGHFKVILPTSCQVFYHLAKLGFLDEKDERVALFLEQAAPRKSKQDQGVYITTGTAPFLAVCGERFHHKGIPVVPVVHVKLWPLKVGHIRYTEPMEKAKQAIREMLR